MFNFWQLGVLLLAHLVCAENISNILLEKQLSSDNYRLPNAVRPEHYQLGIVTFLENPNNLSFAGNVIIKLHVLQDTNNITLHAQNLTIDESSISVKSLKTNENIAISNVKIDTKHDFLIIFLDEMLKQGGNYELLIPFGSLLNSRLRGYYKSSYHDKATNETRWLAVTQFEPASARAAFPCFDEPEYKAKFTVILGHEKKYTALSNMPLKSQIPYKDKPDWVWSEFEESVAMSTYLVAYTVNDFAYLDSKMNEQSLVKFRTWARRDAIDQCDYASVVGPQVLEFYENVFDIKFPLKKIDQMAVPDFSAGAMENWGLVTYRETTLLYADKVSSLASKQRVASVIAHELAHQWFGNLVTMKWWTDIWLNEGFATYVASLGVEHISPEWKLLERESIDNILTVFKLDALENSHPVSQPIKHVSQIAEMFDTISYKKGSSILRMMHLFLGDEVFFAGVANYLKKHAYANAEQDDLWNMLTDTAYKYQQIPNDLNIKAIMDSWTLQTGYPMLTIQRDYATQSATVTQKHYLLNANASSADKNNCWWVPLSYTTQKNSDFINLKPREWLQCSSNKEALPLTIDNHQAGENDWLIFNIQMSGLYRVNYDLQNWDLLTKTLLSKDFTTINTINRAQLIDDSLNLAWSGVLDYDVSLGLLEYLTDEREYIPWKTALDNLNNVNRLLRRTTDYELFKQFMRKILSPIYIYLGGLNNTNADVDNANSILHKSLVAGWACHFEIEDCVIRAQEYFSKWRSIENPDIVNPVPTDLRSTIYCSSIRFGSTDDWNFLWLRYQNSNVASEKRIILSALGCSRDTKILNEYLQSAFKNETAIRKQDSTLAFSAVAHGDVGYSLAKDYLVANIQNLHKFFEPDTTELSRLLSPLSGQIGDKSEYDTITKFVEDNWSLLSKAEQAVRRFLETIYVNTQWRERSYKEIVARLHSKI